MATTVSPLVAPGAPLKSTEHVHSKPDHAQSGGETNRNNPSYTMGRRVCTYRDCGAAADA